MNGTGSASSSSAPAVLRDELVVAPRAVSITAPFSLAETAAPVAWGRGRWPNQYWTGDRFVWCGRGVSETSWRSVSQIGPNELMITGTAAPATDKSWLAVVLGVETAIPRFADPVIAQLAQRHVGARPFAYGSIWGGLLASIAGQSVSVQAGALTLSRISALFHPGISWAARTLWPIPSPGQVAAIDARGLVGTGLTAPRAEALVRAAALAAELGLDRAVGGELDVHELSTALVRIPGVGRWTAASALLWGVAAPDAFPTGDVALLRAARLAYRRPEMTMVELDSLADRWRPHRGWASRLLWLNLLGPAARIDAGAKVERRSRPVS